MVIVILSIALLVALIGLGIEIGITSWSIRRASRYQSKESAVRHDSERAESERRDAERRLTSLDDFTTKIAWLLNFLYKRYDRFGDLEKEIEDGLKPVTEDTSDELNTKFEDLKKALKIIKVTVRASERVENLMESIASQVGQIVEDLRESDYPAFPAENKKEEDKPEPAPAESETSESAE